MLEISELSIHKIKPAAYNPRKDLKPGDPAYDKLAKVIETFDLVEPLVWNKRTGNLVGGHQRFKILVARGDKKIPVSVVDLDDTQEKALNLALNKHSGEWEFSTLADLLTELDTGGLDMEITGFSDEELERLMTWTGAEDGDAGSGHNSLAAKFGIPPFSVLNAREGWWQERKRAWLSLGIQSELGRGGGEKLTMSQTVQTLKPSADQAAKRSRAQIGGGIARRKSAARNDAEER